MQQAAGRKPINRPEGFGAAYLRSRHCSGLIHADRLRDEASDLGKIRELDATAH